MKCRRKFERSFACFALALVYLLGAVPAAAPQEKAKPSPEKWRPKDGLYVEPGENFNNQCNEYGELVIELAEKTVSGHEWGCKVTKLTDTTPGTVDLDLTCYDSEEEGKESTKIMSLTRISGKSISVRQTEKGSVTTWQGDYCPDKDQRSHIRQRARERAAAKKKR